jgi:hypothetical protein
MGRKLIGRVDHPQPVGSEFKVILKLENITKRYYVMFHRVPGEIATQYDNSNTISVVESPNQNEAFLTSELIEEWSSSQHVLLADFNGPGKHLTLTVKSIDTINVPAFAEIVVEVLGQDTAVPTSAPPTTSSPTTSLPTAIATTAMPTPTTAKPTDLSASAFPTRVPTGSPLVPETTLPTTSSPTTSSPASSKPQL